jgi:hypothetical protein
LPRLGVYGLAEGINTFKYAPFVEKNQMSGAWFYSHLQWVQFATAQGI